MVTEINIIIGSGQRYFRLLAKKLEWPINCVSLCAVISNANNYNEIYEFGKAKSNGQCLGFSQWDCFGAEKNR